MITELNEIELKDYNGGRVSSDDPSVQAGLTIGQAIGRIIGNTIHQVKSIFDIF